MVCIECSSNNLKVVESREAGSGDSIRRRRECCDCGHRFTTYERFEAPTLVVIKANGDRESFSREKVFRGVQRACEKTDVTTDQIEKLVDDVERSLRSKGDREIKAKEIGQQIMKNLESLSDIAYIRFASVYLQFNDVEVLEKMVKKIQSKKSTKNV